MGQHDPYSDLEETQSAGHPTEYRSLYNILNKPVPENQKNNRIIPFLP